MKPLPKYVRDHIWSMSLPKYGHVAYLVSDVHANPTPRFT